MIYSRDWPVLGCLALGRGLLLMLVVVSLWGIPALVRTHGEFFRVGIGRHVIGRSLSDNGRPWRGFVRGVSAAVAVLLCNGFYQFFSLVD